jgi:ribosomal 50S subunit-recycling heat shock protein
VKRSKKRLDVLLVERGLAQSRQRAQAMILAGEVLVNGERKTIGILTWMWQASRALMLGPLPVDSLIVFSSTAQST